ncbi:unnamed protein product [Adineta ricciae]|uniref:Uncharacterized protein n=1 Tax=Adineta ricciae TaxID=249248 RepID=A0A815K754_ADIRI|nr:unnamed protein product [Adineta ricciae]CAF1391780.1 unnamed protein product [Adineta ricciae]
MRLFSNEKYQAGASVFQLLVTTTADNPSSEYNCQIWQNLNNFNRPFLTLFSDSDSTTNGLDKVIQSMIPDTSTPNNYSN